MKLLFAFIAGTIMMIGLLMMIIFFVISIFNPNADNVGHMLFGLLLYILFSHILGFFIDEDGKIK